MAGLKLQCHELIPLAGLILFTGCGSSSAPVSTSSQSVTAASNTTTSSNLTLSGASATVAPNGTDQFTATGGVPPYQYSVAFGGGTIDPSSGIFTATGTTSTTIEIEVQDSSGNSSFLTVTVSSAGAPTAAGTLTLTAASPSVLPGGTDLLTGSGGTAPYSYFVVSGTGTINSTTGLFTAPGATESDQIVVQDANGNLGYATITVSTTATATVPAIPAAATYTSLVIAQGEIVVIPGGPGNLELIMQSDGNLVLYTGITPLWSTNTSGQLCVSNQCRAIFQADGNFVVYNGSVPIWDSRTVGNPGATLLLNDEAPYLEIESSGGPVLWTSRRSPPSRRG